MKFAEYVAIAGDVAGKASSPLPGLTVIVWLALVLLLQRP